MDAELIRENRHGMKIMKAETGRETWPGYHESMPLGRPGYWMGSARDHWHVGENASRAMHEFKSLFDPSID